MVMQRSLLISTLGDFPPPIPYGTHPLFQSTWSYLCEFTILACKTSNQNPLTITDMALLMDQFSQLRCSLPESLRFGEDWLENKALVPDQPFDVYAACLHLRSHGLLMFLSQRLNDNGGNLTSKSTLPTENNQKLGILNMIQSCREVLYAFKYFRLHAPPSLLCWTVYQQVYSAAKTLGSYSDTASPGDLELSIHTWQALSEAGRSGNNLLVQTLAEKLGLRLGGTYASFHLSCSTECGPCSQHNRNSGSEYFSHGLAFEPEQAPVASATRRTTATPALATEQARRINMSSRKASGRRAVASRVVPRRSSSSLSTSPAFEWSGHGQPMEVAGDFQLSEGTSKHADVFSEGLLASYSALENCKSPTHPSSIEHGLTDPKSSNPAAVSYQSAAGASLGQGIVTVSNAWRTVEAGTTTAPLMGTVAYMNDTKPPFSAVSNLSPDHAHSYPPSTYADSSTSSLQTPSLSHPVSPATRQENATQVYCLGHVQQQHQQLDNSVFAWDSATNAELVDAMDSGFHQALALNDDLHTSGSKLQWVQYTHV